MKDGYKYRDGKVIVVDYDQWNTKREEERKYQDNIEELLMAENVRDYLIDYENKVNISIEKNNREIKEWKSERALRIVVMFFVTILVGMIVGTITSILFIVSALICSVITIKLVTSCNKIIKKYEKEIAGFNLTLEGIGEELEKNKINLRKLINDDRVDCENIKGRNYVQLNYVEELKKLKDYLQLWYVVGEDEEKLLRYDKRDKLYTKLEKDFEQEDIKTLRRILNRNKRKY